LLSLAHPGLFLFLALLFALGVTATSFRFADKQSRGPAQADGGRREAAEVFGAAGMAALTAPAAYAAGSSSANAYLLCLAPLVAKTMDTVSSEIGKARRGNTFTLWPLRRCEPGTKGGISAEGTAAGLLAACFVAAPLALFGWGGWERILLLAGVSLAANAAESVYSAWVSRHGLDDGKHTSLLLTLAAAAFLLIF
jgi:uncharacterized protein (TIGR00297 family)